MQHLLLGVLILVLTFFSFGEKAFAQDISVSQDKIEHSFGRALKHFGDENLQLIVDESEYLKFIGSDNREGEGKEVWQLYMKIKLYEYRLQELLVANSRVQLVISHGEQLQYKERGRLYAKISTGYKHCRNFALSNYFLKECKKYPDIVSPQFVNSNIGLGFLEMKVLDSAIYYLELSLKDTERGSSKGVGLLSDIGFAYFLNESYQKSYEYYQDALEAFSIEAKDSNHYYNLKSNIASLMVKRKEYDIAIELLEEVERRGDKFPGLYAEVQLKKVDVLILTERFDELKKYLEESDVTTIIELPIKNKLHQLKILIRAYISLREFNHVSPYLKEIHDVYDYKEFLSDSIGLSAQQGALKVFKSSGEMTKLHLAQIKLTNGSLKKAIALVISISIVCIVIFLFILKLRRKRNRLMEEVSQVTLDNKRLELDKLLSITTGSVELMKELDTKLQGVLQKKEMAKEIRSVILFVKEQAKVEHLRQRMIDSADSLGELLFRDRIIERHSNLTSSELQLAILLRLGMGNTEIAMFKNAELTSVRTLKNRLKNKLDIGNEIDLSQYLKGL